MRYLIAALAAVLIVPLVISGFSNEDRGRRQPSQKSRNRKRQSYRIPNPPFVFADASPTIH